MEAGAPVLTTHTQLLVAQAKRDAKKEELRRLSVERAAVRARCAAVEAELYELEGQTRALYAQEAVERMRAHPGEVSVQRDGCGKVYWVAAYPEGRDALEGVGAEAVIEAALRHFTSDACVQSDGQAALVSMRRRVATRPADDLA